MAFRDPGPDGSPPRFDHTAFAAGRLADPDRRPSIESRVRSAFGRDAVIHWSPEGERPHFVWRPAGLLARLPDPGKTLETRVREFLLRYREALGLTAPEVDALELSAVQVTANGTARRLTFRQRVGKIPVFRGQVRVTVDREDGVIAIGGPWHPGLRAPRPAALGAAEALAIASRGLGLSGDVPDPVREEPGGDRRTIFPAGGEYAEAPVVRLVVLPEGAGASRLAWEVRLMEAVSGRDDLWRVLVDAVDGTELLRERTTLYVADPADATGLVFEKTPEDGPRVEKSFAGDPVASPAHWVAAGQTFSRGNNVAARRDWGGNNRDETNPMADGGNALQFDFPFLDTWATEGRIGDTDAAITNAFWLGNLYHDVYYPLGFDEPSGNYQDDNFGRGGIGGDHVNVDVQDSYSLFFMRNNANWSPSEDGTPPRTNYFLWTNPDRDGAFDATVIWHEFTHGLSTRLVGGPATICLSGPQPGGMGEGWSDFFAVSYFSGPDEDPAGPAIVGAYVTGNHDRGIRRYPYHHDKSIDPLTYADLCDNGTCEVHDEGEIWATVLWDVRYELIQQYGYDEGRQRAELLAIDGMKLSPCNPNMVEERDAILQADRERYGGADECLLRRAFARRGLGGDAWSDGTGADAGADFAVGRPLGASLRFPAGEKDRLTWDAGEDAVSWQVARGDFGAGAASGTFDDAECRGEVDAPSWTDDETPATGARFYYLVAVRDACGLSGWGRRSDGTQRTVISCP